MQGNLLKRILYLSLTAFFYQTVKTEHRYLRCGFAIDGPHGHPPNNVFITAHKVPEDLSQNV